MENDPKDKKQQGELRWPEAWARRMARTEESKLRATLEDNLTTALREDPQLAEALEKVTQAMANSRLKADWSCCRGV